MKLALASFAVTCAVYLTSMAMPPVTSPAGTFDLVQYHGEESDIIDYDLSLSDCVNRIDDMRGLDVTCEFSK